MAFLKTTNRAMIAQAAMEYAVLFAVVCTAFLVMKVYVKRANQGRLKTTIDEMAGARLFSPENSNSSLVQSSHAVTREINNADGSSRSEFIGEATDTTNTSDDFSGVPLQEERMFNAN